MNLEYKNFKIVKKPNIKKIQDYIDSCEEQVNRTNKQLAEYDKDIEISRIKDELTQLRNNSLYIMSDLESEKAKQFREEHYKKCNNGNSYWYNLIGTGIGTIIKIKCDKCGKIEDITDDSNW